MIEEFLRAWRINPSNSMLFGAKNLEKEIRNKTIDKTLEIINRELALLEERLRIETCEGRWVDEEKCLFAIERLEHLAEQIKGDNQNENS